MRIELDHLFVCTAAGAPEAEKLLQVGLREGVPNQHPGQGTANRRFDFVNAMIELVWVSDAKEAQSPRARRTLLWERWSGRAVDASPFGICLRPANSGSHFLACRRFGSGRADVGVFEFHATGLSRTAVH